MTNESQQNLENAQAQMRKGTLEFAILLIIKRGSKMYAPDILKELMAIDLAVVEGTIYPLLNRLKREELLEYSWEESKAGPPRKYYNLTAEGKTFALQLAKTWKQLSASIDSLLS